MYLALFLAPWILMYALSTMAMNHRELVRGWYGGVPPAYEPEAESTYNGILPDGADPSQAAEQILGDLGLEGSYAVQRVADGPYVILRRHPVRPRRITYEPATGRLTVEREVFRAPEFLERLHRRRGFQAGITPENAWAFSVDLVIVAMIFWVASGLWMWWALRATRRWGALAALSGAAVFALFLVTI